MRNTLRRLTLGLSLVVLVSSLLLISDWIQRVRTAGRTPRVAILQYASDPVLDDGIDGMIEALAAQGFLEGRGVAIRRYNAQGDGGNLNAIAREMANGRYDLLLTVTTPVLQAVANANREGRTPHVFGLVTDPFAAGGGLDRDQPLAHPAHLVGIGSFEPVASNLRFAKKLFPALKVVGVVWNPAEANSQACMVKARAICRDLGVELLEANADNSAGVLEASDSLVARGAQALWVAGDNTANIALEAIISSARKGRIPVFTTNVGSAARGALFDLGPDYRQVGRLVGELAAAVLRGADTRAIPIRDVVPEQVMINPLMLKNLKDPWVVSAETLAQAQLIVDAAGVHRNTPVSRPSHAGTPAQVNEDETHPVDRAR